MGGQPVAGRRDGDGLGRSVLSAISVACEDKEKPIVSVAILFMSSLFYISV